MGEYKPPFTITNEILSYVSSISEKIGRITAISSLETKPHLRKNNRIKSIHSSLKIEANSLSLGQVRDVINGRLVLGEQKEIQEVKNAYAAYENSGTSEPKTAAFLRRNIARIAGMQLFISAPCACAPSCLKTASACISRVP